MHKSGTMPMFDLDEKGEFINIIPEVRKIEYIHNVLTFDRNVKLIDANKLYQEEITKILFNYSNFLNRTSEEVSLEIIEKRNNSILENDYFHNDEKVWHSDVKITGNKFELIFILDYLDLSQTTF